MKPAREFRYTVNGAQRCRGCAVITFGEDALSRIEAAIDSLDGIGDASISVTSKMGNRLTVAKEN